MYKQVKLTLAIVFLSCTCIQVTESYKILFILPIATKSHKNVFEPLVRALAERGHDITMVSPSETSGLPKNVHEITPLTIQDFISGFAIHPMRMRAEGKLNQLLFLNHNVARNCEKVYKDSEFQKMLALGPNHFDLIFFNGYFNQCFFGLHSFLKAPFIIITTMGSPLFISRLTGNYYPTSFVPFPFLGYSQQMNFIERVTNFASSYFVNALIDSQNSKYESVYRKYLGNNTEGLDEISRNVSLIMGNEHHVLTFPKPNLPDIIPIGGMICRTSNPLPKDLEEFVSSAEHGFIYFSMGSILTPADLPKSHLELFIRVFSRLKQRVIWKWDSEDVPNAPNVLVKKWLPQQDILGHPNLKLFITHGGLLSTQEAVYHGVPLLGIPIFVDQDLNMQNAEEQGYALTTEILELNEDEFDTKIRRLLTEPQFREKAKKLSELFRDSQETPLERAIFWSEYVMRHKGAVHLRSAARYLNVFQLHSIDVICFLTGVFLVAIYLLKLISFFVFNLVLRIFTKTSKQKIQ